MYTQEEVLTLMQFAKVLAKRTNDRRISLLNYVDNAYCLIKDDNKWKIQNGNTAYYYENLIDALCALINYAYTYDNSSEYQEYDFTIELEKVGLIDKENAERKRIAILSYLHKE